jgi:hypothetical protein
MTFTFRPGKHGSRPYFWIHWFPFLFRPFRICRKVMFTAESKYQLPGTHQENRNKMVGISYWIDRHKCSARFCWRNSPTPDKFIISSYCYINGELHMEDLCQVPALHWYKCTLLITSNAYHFYVHNERNEQVAFGYMSKGHNRRSGWLLGPYFGGAMPAPKKISIELKKSPK